MRPAAGHGELRSAVMGRERGVDVMVESGSRAANPVWVRPVDAIGLVLRGRTAHTAGPIAAVVGTVLSLVNQGDVIISGQANASTWVRIAVNYLVPFIVASVAYLSACRRMGGRPTPDAPRQGSA
jgi:hypothetical protein